jgi:hypothetical protein
MLPLFKGLAKELRSEGCTVKVVAGWKERGRPFTFGPIKGMMYHHTASNKDSGNLPALGICTHGRSDLPGPLCQFLVGRNGTIVFIAAGYANHAGAGSGHGLAGNSDTIGVECENNGLGEPWPKEQLAAIATLFAVLLKRTGLPTSQLIGHKEWTTRKPDPAGIDMGAFRTRVSRRRKTVGQTQFKLVAVRVQKRTAFGWDEKVTTRRVKTVAGGNKAREIAGALRDKGWKVEVTKLG